MPDKTRASQTLWEYGNNKAFLIHAISVMSYCDHKNYFQNYEEAKKKHTQAVFDAIIANDLFMVLALAPEGTISQEQNYLAQAKAEVVTADAKRIEIAGGAFSL